MDGKALGDTRIMPMTVVVSGSNNTVHAEPHGGITLRQHYAGLAMQAELMATAGHAQPVPEHVAHYALKCADALLAALAIAALTEEAK